MGNNGLEPLTSSTSSGVVLIHTQL